MSRRKQLKPQQIQINVFSLSRDAEDTCLCCAHVCRRCCAEFSLLSDLEHHQAVCSPDAPVLLVSEDEDLLCISKSLPAASAELGETALNVEVENSDSPSRERSYKHADVMNYRRRNRGSAESSGNICSNQNISGTDASVFPEPVPPSDGYLWRRNEVFVENLQSTKEALAQFSQPVDSDSRHSKTSTSSPLQQLLGLQIQQIQQLQLADLIRHQVLLFASHLAEIPDALLVCTKDLPPPDPFSQLRALSAHLSQELAAASGTATILSAQSADTSDLKHFTPTEQLNQSRRNGKRVLSSSESSQTFSQLTTAFHKHVSKEQHTDCGAAHSELNVPSQTKTSSLMFGKNSSPNIGAIVKDLGALAASARQRKRKNLKLFTPNTSSAECLCKHTCRFCSRVFGKDSALQSHLRSHSGERPHRCSICGNWFSTRGNLKVHVETHPPIKKHLYVPEHNIQTSAVSLSVSPGTAARRSDGSLSSMSPDNTSPVVKKDDDWMSVPTKTSQQRTTNLKSDGVKASFNVSKMVDLFTRSTSTSFSGLRSLRRSDEVQLLSDAADKRASDLSECVLCPRAFSCQSGLRTHHRTHSGGRPYQSHLCGRAFTSKGDPNTHQTVQLRLQHSCQSELTNTSVLQKHEGQRSNADRARQKHSACRRKEEYDNKGAFSDKQLSTFKSLCIHLSPLHTNLTGADRRTRYDGPHGELPLPWIQSERSEGSNERRQTNKQPAAEKGHSLAPEQFLSARGQTSASSKTNLNKAFDSTALKLRRSASEPKQKPFNAPSVGPSLREKKNNYCDICGKKFACQSAVEIHYRSHTKERPFICTTCDRGFSTKGNLKQHTLTHQMRDFPSNLFKPSAANEALEHGSSTLSDTNSSAFRSRQLLPGRSQSVTPRQRLCSACGKSFSSCSALQIHQRTHSGERPFGCAVCGRAFTTKGNLKVHMGTHMWSGAPCRRGSRLSVGIRTRPVKPPEKNPDVVSNSRASVYCREESPEVFSAGLRIKDVASPQQDT